MASTLYFSSLHGKNSNNSILNWFKASDFQHLPNKSVQQRLLRNAVCIQFISGYRITSFLSSINMSHKTTKSQILETLQSQGKRNWPSTCSINLKNSFPYWGWRQCKRFYREIFTGHLKWRWKTKIWKAHFAVQGHRDKLKNQLVQNSSVAKQLII